jgi:hypothetical protein
MTHEDERDPLDLYWAMAERYPELVREAIEHFGYRKLRQTLSGKPDISEADIKP